MRPQNVKTSKLPRSCYLLLLAALGLSLFSGCFESPDDEEDDSGLKPLPTDPYFIGDYTVRGDTIFMHLPADTSWICYQEEPEMKIDEPETDTTLFDLAGNQLRLISEEDTLQSFETEGGGEAVVRSYTQFQRAGSGAGLEGYWRWESSGHEVISGIPNAEYRSRLSRSDQLLVIQLSYVTIELELTKGKAWGRSDGDFAGLFVARWNGDFEWDSLDTPDSARYAIDVKKLGTDAVELTGQKTGEVVTITFMNLFDNYERYSSSRSERKPYNNQDYRTQCGIDGWFSEFQFENDKRSIPPIELEKRSRHNQPLPQSARRAHRINPFVW